MDRLYGRPEVSVREISGIVYGSGSEDPPEYPAGSALRSPDGPLGAVVHPEITNNTPRAKNEQAAIRIRAAPADPDTDHGQRDRTVRLTSRLTPAIAAEFPILPPAKD